MKIILSKRKIYQWNKIGNVWFTGNWEEYDNDKKNIIYILENGTKHDIIAMIKNIKGNFAFIVERKSSELVLCVDIARSIPLFFDNENGYVSDCVDFILQKTEEEISQEQLSSLLAASYCQSGFTVFENIKQCEAGQIIFLDTNKKIYNRNTYYYHFNNLISKENDVQLKSKLKNILNSVFKDMINSLRDKCVVLPLSGGYDSRLIACMLKEAEVKNVICFTYGIKNDYEVKNSRMVANKLGYEWHFIEYKKDNWKSLLVDSDFSDYCDFASNHCVFPHLQEILAIKQLIKNRVIKKNAVVIPGHCAGLPAGSFINEDLLAIETLEELEQYLYDKHFRNFELKEHFRKNNIERIHNELEPFCQKYGFNKEIGVKLSDMWSTKNREAEYIVNSIRLFEFYDLEWRLPFWDKRFLDFWYKLGLNQRKDKRLYVDFLFEDLFKKNHVEIKKPTINAVRKKNDGYLKKIILKSYDKFTTYFCIKCGLFTLVRNNTNNFNYLAHVMYKHLNDKSIFMIKYKGVMQVGTLWWCEKKYGATLIKQLFLVN